MAPTSWQLHPPPAGRSPAEVWLLRWPVERRARYATLLVLTYTRDEREGAELPGGAAWSSHRRASVLLFQPGTLARLL